MNEKGITLMELLVVIAIMATITGIMVLSTQGLRQTYALKAAAREVFGDMQRARLAAIREGRAYIMCFAPVDTSSTTDRVFTSYYFVLNDGADDTICTNDDERPERWSVQNVAQEYRGMTFAENFSGTSVRFNPSGSSSAGNVKVSGSELTKSIIVNGHTGNIRIE